MAGNMVVAGPEKREGEAAKRRAVQISFCRDQRGSNAVEFAIIAPVICLMMLVILFYGVYLGIANSLQQISADTGRYAMVGKNAAERNELVGRWITNTAGNYPLIVPARLTYQTVEDGTTLMVSVSYDITYLPQPPMLLTNIVKPPTTILRSATVFIP
ncbi:MAG: pilus assembly protein [Zymomonas sp.]|nr:MAG: pilus assembly protein [Zymomonas sp.]